MKNLQYTIPFLTLILLVPGTAFGQNADKYSLDEINSAFENTENYVTYTDKKNQMKIDVASMKSDGIDKKDIKIIKQYAKVHNKIMKSFLNHGNMTAVVDYAKTGKFSQLFTPTELPITGQSHQNTDYLSLYACGIWAWQSHTEPPVLVGKQGYSSLSAIQKAIVSDGYHQVQQPWADKRDVGYTYAKINPIGIGGCNGGEFRDENHIYSPDAIHEDGKGNILTDWHSLTQFN